MGRNKKVEGIETGTTLEKGVMSEIVDIPPPITPAQNTIKQNLETFDFWIGFGIGFAVCALLNVLLWYA